MLEHTASQLPPAAPVCVLFVHHGDQWIRGSERFLLDHLRHLDRRRFRPVLWTNCGPLADEVAASGVTVVRDRFTLFLDYQGASSPRETLRLIRKGVLMIRRHAVTVVHCNASPSAQWMVPAARWCGVPVVVQPHNNLALRSRCVQLVHQATAVIGVSDSMLKAFRDDGMEPRHLHLVHNTVDPARLNKWPVMTRGGYGVTSDDFLFVAAGALVHIKGFDVLLTAFAATARERPGVRLILVGDGPLRDALERQTTDLGVSSSVTFLGERDDAAAILRDVADAVVIASRDEVLPLVLLEAAHAGKACIATAVGGVPEIIKHAVTGLLVPPEDPAALAQAMQTLFDDRSLGRQLGAALRDAASDLVAPRGTRRIEQLYADYVAPDAVPKRFGFVWRPAYSRWLSSAVFSVWRHFGGQRRLT